MAGNQKSNVFQYIFLAGVIIFVFILVFTTESNSSNKAKVLSYEESIYQKVKDSLMKAKSVEERAVQDNQSLQEIERRQFMAQYSTEQIEAVNKNYSDLIDSGGVKVRFDKNTAQIDPVLWMGFDMDGKKTLMQIIQLKSSFEKLKMPSEFTYYNMKTGRELASYSEWDGFLFK